MALTKSDSLNKPKVGIPPAFRDRYVIRAVEHSFGPNSKGNPMITIQWEVVGKPNPDGSVSTSITKGNQEYKIAGIKGFSTYHTLTEKALGYYEEFWLKAHPGETIETYPGVDIENPDTSYIDGLAMQAVLSGQEVPLRTELTDEEKEALKAEGKDPIGEVITDEDGNPLTRPSIRIEMMLKKWGGELPPV